jgi:hypothetical protein
LGKCPLIAKSVGFSGGSTPDLSCCLLAELRWTDCRKDHYHHLGGMLALQMYLKIVLWSFSLVAVRAAKIDEVFAVPQMQSGHIHH